MFPSLHAVMVALLILVSSPVAAQLVRFTPAVPTSEDEVTARLRVVWSNGCAPEGMVSREGAVIRVELKDSGQEACPAAVTVYTIAVSLGYLEPGIYRVEVAGALAAPQPATLRVWPHSLPFGITLDAAPERGGYDVTLVPDVNFCFSPTCDPVTVTFGGVPATNLRRRTNAITVTAPPHPAGAVDLRISNFAQTVTASNAFVYFSESASPDFALFEPVLFPLLAEVRGSGGSHWTTDAILVNRSSERPLVSQYPLDTGSTFPEQDHHVLRGERRWPRGMIWLPLRVRHDAPSAALVVRELSRRTSFELPVVREQEFSQLVALVGVPRDQRYRRTLRIYSYDEPLAFEGPVFVSVNGLTTGVPLGSGRVTLTRHALDEPWFATLDLNSIPLDAPGPGNGDEMLEVQVSSGSRRLWAFLSIVDDETQHPRIVTPLK